MCHWHLKANDNTDADVTAVSVDENVVDENAVDENAVDEFLFGNVIKLEQGEGGDENCANTSKLFTQSRIYVFPQ